VVVVLLGADLCSGAASLVGAVDVVVAGVLVLVLGEVGVGVVVG
jgi:hypothetical protein